MHNVGTQLDLKPANTSDQETPPGLREGFNSQDTEEDSGEVTSESTSGRGDDSSSADHDYCSLAEPAVEPEHGRVLAERLHGIASKMNRVPSVDKNQKETVLKLLDYVEDWIDGQADEEKLADATMALLRTRFDGRSVYSSPLLQAVASWLGRRFHEANGSVSHQVEGFKLRNIEHIKDLPPAEDLAAELFPEAMRNLLIHWMGLSEEAATWKRLSEYPIVLLILEFANHNLITGVAHVLYSSLICR